MVDLDDMTYKSVLLPSAFLRPRVQLLRGRGRAEAEQREKGWKEAWGGSETPAPLFVDHHRKWELTRVRVYLTQHHDASFRFQLDDDLWCLHISQ